MAPPLSKEIITDSDSSSEESSESELQTKPSAQKPIEKTKPKKQLTIEAKEKANPESSSPSSESEPGEESESSDGEEPSALEMVSTLAIAVPAQEFKAPDGFKVIPTMAPRSSDVSKAFSDLREKQLWHITAPASVPMNSIQEFAFDAVAQGQSIFNHKGINYKLHEGQMGADKNKALLLPDKEGNTYHRSHVNIAQTFHLERIVDLANGVTYSEQSVQISELTKPVRKQPKHLKMRYKPFGASVEDEPETSGFGSEESEGEGASFRMPPTLSLDGEGKKRRKSSMEVEPDNEQRERRKKHKRIHSHSAAGGPEDISLTEDVAPSPRSKNAVDAGIARGRTGEQLREKGNKKHRNETSQERRARKEERKRRKQALTS
ncbi:uncharacterized protein PADG_05112 [Paracoccidioides brasiliensis Pb18]|uniref:DNA-directed RNA polymerase I subunit RPA34.5 n=1 Tax=Paracoccidioides brasiliensis (strain Pb18) TaxID=502780 RepID=C1GCX6_PARBD|nr:uncharacterized protein PADG_05112 [Paracoccidioides brasiliensis Pb18]EEH49033.1 hypothetical protein PADG_05112 [Paracoccidioides brasiliensis Pb18]